MGVHSQPPLAEGEPMGKNTPTEAILESTRNLDRWSVKEILEANPPYGARVRVDHMEYGAGWDAPPLAPWLEASLTTASREYFGREAMHMGEGVAALLLASIGLYGVLSYSARQRTSEIGIRMAFGAGENQIVKLIVGQGMVLALIGLGIGVGVAVGLTRVMETMLVEVTPTDPLTFVGISALFAGVALVACYLPARRATRVDPMVTLRDQ